MEQPTEEADIFDPEFWSERIRLRLTSHPEPRPYRFLLHRDQDTGISVVAEMRSSHPRSCSVEICNKGKHLAWIEHHCHRHAMLRDTHELGVRIVNKLLHIIATQVAHL